MGTVNKNISFNSTDDEDDTALLLDDTDDDNDILFTPDPTAFEELERAPTIGDL